MKDLFKIAEDLVKSLSPQQLKEMRKIYSEQKRSDKSLDETVQDLTEEIKDSFKHDRTPK